MRAGKRRGFSLIEVIVAVGVLALVVPMVLAAMVRGSETAARARAENRAVMIVGTCLEEVEAARHSRSKLLDPIPQAGVFPDAVNAIGFNAAGVPLGKVEAGDYEQGARDLEGVPVRYLARIDGLPEKVREDAREMRSLRIKVEYPAAAPAKRRRVLEFYSRVP